MTAKFAVIGGLIGGLFGGLIGSLSVTLWRHGHHTVGICIFGGFTMACFVVAYLVRPSTWGTP